MSFKDLDYSSYAKYYDIIELGGGEGPITSELITKILKRYKIKSILDITCGTGAQSIGLANKGYKVVASDIDKQMLDIARRKAKEQKLKISFHKGDMRNSRFGKFDAVIAMFNAIGHLSKKDFEKALRNISLNLKEDGYFIFDIHNLDYYQKRGYPKHKFIADAGEKDGIKYVRFVKTRMNLITGLLTELWETYIQEDYYAGPKIIKAEFNKQIYSAEDLKEILRSKGFQIVEIRDRRDSAFSKNESESMLVVTKKN